MNRGIANRAAFEGRRDIEGFLDLLAIERQEGRLEVHAYSVLTTHFHLIVRSPRGELAEAMRRVDSAYVRRFNHERARDGPLFRGRYCSRLVTTGAYLETLLWYVDLNPVKAGLAVRATEYPFGSAWHYARTGEVPWLDRGVIEGMFGAPGAAWDPARYPDAKSGESMEWVAEVVERRLACGGEGADPWRDLVRSNSAGVQAWMESRARLADGSAKPCILVSVAGVLRESGRLLPDRTGDNEERGRIVVGLLREVSGLPLEAIAHRLARSTTWVRARARAHREAMDGDPRYRSLAAEVVAAVIAAEVGRIGPGAILPIPGGPSIEPRVMPFPHRGAPQLA